MPDLPDALCKGEDPELWFGPHVCGPECDGERGCFIAKAETGRFKRISTAKAICRVCPEVEECLIWALRTQQPFGIWGGTTERDRRVILKERAERGD